MIQPAVRHFILYLAETYSMDILVEQFENLYSVIFAYIQWNSLTKSGGSIIESLYGLHRINYVPSIETDKEIYAEGAVSLTNKQKILSVAYIIVLPRVMSYFRDLAKRIRERNLHQSNNRVQPDRASQYAAVEQSGTTAVVSSIRNAVEGATQLFASAFPFLEFAGDMSVFTYQLLYLCGKSEFHHPIFALLGMALHRARSSDGALIRNVSRSGTTSASHDIASPATTSNYGNWPATLVLALVLAVRAAEYLRNNSGNLSTHSLSQRLAAPVPLPPRPQPIKVGRGCVIPPIDVSLCPLCSKKRTNPCASTGGYVFCYLCILPHVREQGKCPVTALPCRELDIVRLFEECNE